MMPRGSSKTAVLVSALGFFCVAALVIGLVVLLVTRDDGGGGNDVLKGLPTTPPTMADPRMQAFVDSTFRWESNCWQANHWARVTLPSLTQQFEAAIAGVDPKAPAAKKQVEASIEAFRTSVTFSFDELISCGEGAWFTAPGRKQESMPQVMQNFYTEIAKLMKLLRA